MDGSPDLSTQRKKSFKERMWFKGMGCCGGPIWGFHANTITVDDDDQDEGQPRVLEEEGEEQGDSEIHHQLPQQDQVQPCSTADDPFRLASDPGCTAESPSPVSRSMNLAAALAAERNYRASQEPEPAAAGATGGTEDGVPAVNATPTIGTAPGTPFRMSLMRLLEEADGGEEETAAVAAAASGGGCDWVCCVCMGRKKGAAFIPCGHTYCRVCSRELWLNRGSCPLCNRPILEILDIF